MSFGRLVLRIIPFQALHHIEFLPMTDSSSQNASIFSEHRVHRLEACIT